MACQRKSPAGPETDEGFVIGGQYWIRTSDLYHVKVAL